MIKSILVKTSQRDDKSILVKTSQRDDKIDTSETSPVKLGKVSYPVKRKVSYQKTMAKILLIITSNDQ